MNSSKKTRRKYLRFGLLELLLVTGVVAAWLPTFVAIRRIPELESQVEVYQDFSTNLDRVDPNQLCVRRLKQYSFGTAGWKYFLPADVEMELRLATEKISKLTQPSQFESVKLPEGEHCIYLREFRDVNKDYVKQVYVDDAIVLTSRHPESWLDSSGSSYQNLPLRSTAYPLTEPLELRKARYRYSNNKPVGQRRIYSSIPGEYDAKGCCLWIAPADHVTDPAPKFISPQTPRFNRQLWGHRQGIRIGDLNSSGSHGLINVVAVHGATVGDERNHSDVTNRLSIRPVVADSSNDKAELPELQQSFVNGRPGLMIGLSNSLTSPNGNDPSPLAPMGRRYPSVDDEQDVQDAISQDGKTMRIFVHYESDSSGFPSGARPVVKTIFDADHPNRIGLLPKRATGSAPLKAVQIVTTLDARYRRRRIDLIVDGQVKTVPLPKLEQAVGGSSDNPNRDQAVAKQSEDVWQTISLAEIPVDQSAQMRKLRFSTDVKDFSKTMLPASVDPDWNYEGVSNCQTWWFPLPDPTKPADQNFKVEILQTAELPTEVPPPTRIAIPGGPVIKSVRITIPMSATEPIWLEITPDAGR